MEGFDHLDVSAAAVKDWNFAQAASISTSYARFNGKGAVCNGRFDLMGIDLGADKTLSTIYFGIACKKVQVGNPVGYGEGTYAHYWISTYDENSGTNLKLSVMTDYSINLYDNGNSLLSSTSAGVFPDLQWFYFEMKLVVHATAGEVVMKINEEVVMNETGIDTQYTAGDYTRLLYFTSINYERNIYYDDMYVDDSQFHGDCRVRTFMPTSNGYTNFTPSTGSNYENVDETTPDEDTTYNEASDDGDKDSYGITSSINGPIIGVQLNNYARKTGDLIVKTKDLVKSGGTDYLSTEEKNQSTSYDYTVSMWENDPDTSSPWTQAGLDAAEFGIEITAMSTTTTTV